MSGLKGLRLRRPCACAHEVLPETTASASASASVSVSACIPVTAPDVPVILTAPSRPSTFAVHHQYTKAVAEHVKNLRVRDKRNIYVAMRLKPDVKTDSFLPHFGLSVADFCVWQTLNEKPRQTTT